MTENPSKNRRMVLFYGVLLTFYAVNAFYRGWMVVGIITTVGAVLMWIGFFAEKHRRHRQS